MNKRHYKTSIFLLIVVLVTSCATDVGDPVVGEAQELDLATLQSWEWHWVATIVEGERTLISSPESYTLVFDQEGFGGQADCNRIRGDYSLDAGGFFITPTISTRALCPPESKGELFVQMIGQSENAQLLGGLLHIQLREEQGTMVFDRHPITQALQGDVRPNQLTE